MNRAACLLLGCLLPAIGAAQTGRPWPEADHLFHSDPTWLGADAAFSADLGRGRVLWLFGDSFIADRSGRTRRQCAFVRNSIAIEQGYDPAHATIRFYTGHRGAAPDDFVKGARPEWYWPVQAIRLEDRLLLFFMRMEPDSSPHSLGFRTEGWAGFLVDNPDADPPAWRLAPLDGPEQSAGLVFGAGLLRDAGFLYAYVLRDSTKDAYLARWPIREAAAGRFGELAWWTGQAWSPSPQARRVVLHAAGPEFSVQADPAQGGYLHVWSRGFGATDIVANHAPRPEGPWSAPVMLYRPPESDAPHAFVYAGKSHPELKGADLILTYAANGSEERVARDLTLYFPRFVRATLPPR